MTSVVGGRDVSIRNIVSFTVFERSTMRTSFGLLSVAIIIDAARCVRCSVIDVMNSALSFIHSIVLTIAGAIGLGHSVLAQEDIRFGLIGLDTSHVIAFTSRLNNADHKQHVAGGKVIAAFKGGSPDIESSHTRVDGFTKTLVEDYGVKLYETIPELCRHVDAILLTSVDGRPHLEQAKPVIEAGLPMFIDKPVAGSLRDAIEIYRLAEEKGVPCFSTSSLRYYKGVVEVASAEIGELRSVISYGPASLEPHHPDLFWYGIHPTEALFTVMSTGCESVVRTSTDATIVVTGEWSGGRIGTLHGICQGKAGYQVTAFGSKGIAKQSQGGDYSPMLEEIVKFVRTGEPPVSPEETLEIYAFMEAADESKRQGGARVKIADVLAKNGWVAK